MNPSPLFQTVGNGCVGIAALIYAVPLQYLVLELSRKKDDGGGILAGLIVLLPMWLLLLLALLCVTAGGGFDALRFPRAALYMLVVLATLSMAALSFLRFEFPRHPNFTTRLVGGLPIYIFPVATMLLVILSLNPRLLPGPPLQAIKLSWLVCATVSLVACGGFFGYRLVIAGGNQIGGIASLLRGSSEANRINLGNIPDLDPQRDFAELARLTSEFQSRAVREAALARLRSNPNFVTTLATGLLGDSPEHALAAVEYATFKPEEAKLLAQPARTAMERITHQTQAEFRHIPKNRRKAMRAWGNRLFRSVADRFQDTGVDFRPPLDAFEKTFIMRDDTLR